MSASDRNHHAASEPGGDALRSLMIALAAGELTDEQAAQLETLLRTDVEARHRYVRYTTLDAMLHWRHVQPLSMHESADADDVAALKPARSFRPQWGGWAAVAAMLMIAVALVVYFIRPEATGPAAQPASLGVAMLSDVSGGQVTLNEDGESLPVGSQLTSGVVSIASGQAQLLFRQGAVVDLAGPCEFRVIGPQHGYLIRGRMRAYVPHRARGFTVSTADGSVVDLGTRFILRVDDGGVSSSAGKAAGQSGGSLVRVVEGRVALRTKSAATICSAGQAMRLIDDRIEDHLTDAQLAKLIPQPQFTHVSFDEEKHKDFHCLGTVDQAIATLPRNGVARVAGRFNGAALFDGSRRLVTTLPGIGGDEPRTVAAWVRIPRDAQPGESYAIAAWGQSLPSGAKWQIGWNRDVKNGAIGALRCEVGGGWVIGSTDLRDDQWHHIAVVLDGPTVNDIHLYLDGRPQAISHRSGESIRIDTQTTGRPITIGGYLDSSNANFRGSIDELYIVHGALSRPQIERLMRDNVLPTQLP